MSGDNTGGGPGRADEDAAWRDIVEHYGDRATLSTEDLGTLGQEPAFRDDTGDTGDTGDAVGAVGAFAPGYDPLAEDPEAFVPPEPPPLPRPPAERLLAWVGVLGSPVAAIVLVVLTFVTSWIPPHWLDALLVLAFLGGFGFLVATMPKDHDDPWDDGARV